MLAHMTRFDDSMAGRENTEMEPPEKKGLSLAAIEAAAWLLHAIMLEVPRVVGVIEVTSAAGDLVRGLTVKGFFFCLVYFPVAFHNPLRTLFS